jgi:hypothetical protein
MMQLANGGPMHLKSAYRLDAHQKKKTRKEKKEKKQKTKKKATAQVLTKPTDGLNDSDGEDDIENQQSKRTHNAEEIEKMVAAMTVDDMRAKIDAAGLSHDDCVEESELQAMCMEALSLLKNQASGDDAGAESKIEEGEEECAEEEDEDQSSGSESEDDEEDEGKSGSKIDGTPLADLRFVWNRSGVDEEEHNNCCAKSTSCCCATFLCGDGRACGGKCCGYENAHRAPVDVVLTVVDLVLACLQVHRHHTSFILIRKITKSVDMLPPSHTYTNDCHKNIPSAIGCCRTGG